MTPTWAIVVAIPLLSLVYLIGVLSIGTGEALLGWLRVGKAIGLAEDATALIGCNDVVVGTYQRLRQEAELPAGSVVAFGLLAVGSTLHAWRIAGWRRFLVAAAIAAIILAAGSLALAIRRLPRQRALQRQFNAKLFELSFHKMKPPNKGLQPSRTHSIRAARLQAKKDRLGPNFCRKGLV
jgi:hypothetical protein